MMSEFLGTTHHEYLFTSEEACAVIPDVIYHLETYEPELIRSAIPNYFLARLAAEHVKVVLTGEGSDELFAGGVGATFHSRCFAVKTHSTSDTQYGPCKLSNT
jgi:asparagine synthetase B (glutamine-hydrolysing)